MSEKVKVRELWYVNNKKLLNRAIAAATWPANIGTEPVSHTSLWEPNENGKFDCDWEVTAPGPYGQCWTSTTRGDANGTVVRPAPGVLDHPENWYYTEHETDKFLFNYAKTFADARVNANKGYSWRDLSRFIMPLWLMKGLRLADNGREICSEHVAQWMVDMGVLDKITIPSPRRLCKAVVLATGSPLRRLIDDAVVRDGNWKKVAPIAG